MADPSLVVRVAANLAEFRANLAEGVSQIETYKGAVKAASAAYDGSRVVQQASAAAAAIQNVGGVSALTSAEMAKANAVFAAAAEKLEIMGKGNGYAAERFRELAAATKASNAAGGETVKVSGEMVAGLKEVAGALGVVMSIGALLEISKEAFLAAGQFEDLSRATGLSIRDIQLWNYVGIEANLTAEDLGRGIEQLSSKLANGDKNATDAVSSLGLSIKTLLAAGPNQAFLDVSDAVSRIQDPMTRAGVATEVWGGKLGKSLLPLLGESGGLRGLLDEAAKSTAIMSDETVQAADRFEKSWKKAWLSFEAFLAGTTVADAWHDFWVKVGVAQARSTDELTRNAAAAKDNAEAQGAQAAAGASVLTNADLLYNRLKSLRESALEPLTLSQRDAIVELTNYGESQAVVAKLVGASEQAVHLYVEAVKQKKEEEKLADQETANRQAELSKAYEQLYKAIGAASHDTMTAQITDAYMSAQASIDAMAKKKGYSIEAEMAIWQAADQTAANIIQRTLESDQFTREHYRLIADKAEEAYKFALDHAGSYTTAEIQLLREKYRDAERASNHWAATAYDDMAKASSATAAHVAQVQRLVDMVHTLAGEYISAAEAQKRLTGGGSFTYDLTSEAGVQQYRQMNPGMNVNWSDAQLMAFAKNGGTLQQLMTMGVISMKPYSARADGGPVSSNTPYLVGERGPELFVPQSSGAIVPNQSMGATQIVIHVTQPLGTPEAIAAAIDQALTARMMNTGTRWASKVGN